MYNSHLSTKHSEPVRTKPIDVYVCTFKLTCICKHTLIRV